MKPNALTILTLAALTACGGSSVDATLTVIGIRAKDVDAVRMEVDRLAGAGKARVLELKDGTLRMTVRYPGSVAELAGALAKSETGLRNVTWFDAQSATVAFTQAETTTQTQAQTQVQVQIPSQAPAAASQTREEPPKEVRMEPKKDSLPFKIVQLDGGSIAAFDGWKVVPIPAFENWIAAMSFPEGKQNDYHIKVYAGTPGQEVLANLYQIAENLLRQIAPGVRTEGEGKTCTFGGNEARVQEYSAEQAGQKYTVQSIIIRKRDVGICIWGVGTPEGMKTYARAAEIVAQSITLRESPPDPNLVGTWTVSNYTKSGTGRDIITVAAERSITIFQNGAFVDNGSVDAGAGGGTAWRDGESRGQVTRRGKYLTFQYDNGKTWSVEYEIKGGDGLVMNGTTWLRQR